MEAKILHSPNRAAASLSLDSAENVPYPADLLPGARDVHSPYGTIRVYEWGPETGRKILFIHGLSTPALALGAVADTLAQRGCRVMILGKCILYSEGHPISYCETGIVYLCLVDLWGRGYSDSPSDLNHDTRLYASQILLAISTSPISWTGIASGGFSLAGYSMGGGIVVSFAGYFPQLVNSIVLMAPGGLYKSLPPEYRSLPVRYPWLFPPTYIKWIMRKLLNGPSKPVSQDHSTNTSRNLDSKYEAPSTKPRGVSKLSEHPIDVPRIVNWEIDHNDGFVYSVASAIRHAPIENQHSAWRLVRSLIEGNEASKSFSGLPNRLYGTKVLLLIGEDDSILPKEQLCRNAQDTLGAGNLKIIEFHGGHGFPITQGVEAAEAMCTFWEL